MADAVIEAKNSLRHMDPLIGTKPFRLKFPWSCLISPNCLSAQTILFDFAYRGNIPLIGRSVSLAKVRKQLPGVSALVDFWWQTVWHDVEHMALPPRWKQWVDELLLPLMYWQEQLSCTPCPGQKAQIAQALKALQDACERHPGTQQLAPHVLANWQAWATEHARAFPRASSAVEGRNGYLSQMQHNHRGLPKHRHQVWTVLHNFAGRAADGTTPASRFFRRAFPDLLESVLAHIEDLPSPRQRHQALAVSS